MTNKPDFWLAFKALTQIRDKLVSQLQSRLYAFNAYYYAFSNKATVMSSVLNGIASSEDIYNDPQFGMDTITKLYFWA